MIEDNYTEKTHVRPIPNNIEKTEIAPKVTIAIPCTKSIYLKKTISSVIDQSYKNFEIIILNNANLNTIKNEIKEIVNSVSDNRLFYYENDYQLPPVENWNKCLELAKGEFFTLLSDDDYYEIDFISELLNLSEKYPSINIFRCRTNIIDESEQVINIAISCPELESPEDFLLNRLKGRELFLSDFLLRTNPLKNKGGFILLAGAWGSDEITWLMMADSGNGIASSSKILFNYRVCSANLTNSMGIENKLKANKDSTTWLINFVHEKYQNKKIATVYFILLNKLLSQKVQNLNRIALCESKNILFLIIKWFKNYKIYHLTVKDLIYSVLVISNRKLNKYIK